MSTLSDIVVVGGGHNGLVAATILARAGRHVTVFERRHSLGGAVGVDEFHPGFKASAGASLVGLLRPQILSELGLPELSLPLIPCDPQVVGVTESGPPLRLWRDSAKTQAELAARSAHDAAAYPKFVAMLTDLARVFDPLFLKTPPKVPDLGFSDTSFLLRRALAARRQGKATVHEATRLPTMSVRAVLNEWFENDLLKATLAMDALLGTFRGPWSPGTAFGLVRHHLARVRGAGWSFVRGGPGRLAELFATAAQRSGVSLRTDSAVERIVVENGHAVGVRLASGDLVPAGIVLSSVDPKRTFLQLVDPVDLPLSFVDGIRNYQSDGALSVVNLALDGLPGGHEASFFPHMRLAADLESIERAYDDAKYGGISKVPILDVVVPTLVDPELAPAGKHVMSILAQYTPYRLKRGVVEDARDEIGDRVVERLDSTFPGLRKKILAREVLTPVDLENRYGLTGGHIYHGEMTINQQYVLRPVASWGRYRTPIDGLYLCGSGAHPGGGITGAPGRNAARQVLSDLRRARAG